jgi:hypothetical protein
MEGQKRKKWTPVEQPDETILKLREKRKWQIALRRYIIERNKCHQYAPYFGLDIEKFRLWIETQFANGLDWTNFSQKWQIDHFVSVNHFDFNSEQDLRLCWHFTNIRVNPVLHEATRTDLLTARQYFLDLHQQTNLSICQLMIRKIDAIEQTQRIGIGQLSLFIKEKSIFLGTISDFSAYEFDQLNKGVEVDEILAERELLRNFS